jgi:hypothetical protein
MQLADQTKRQGQVLQPLQAEHHGVDVVRDLTNIIDRLPGLRVVLETEQIGERRLRPLDLRGQDSLLAHVHVKKRACSETVLGAFANP